MIRATPLLRNGLLAIAKTYAKTSRMPLRKVSRLAYGDARFFAKVAKGAMVSDHAYDKVMEWFEEPKNWPHGVVPPEIKDPLAGVEQKP